MTSSAFDASYGVDHAQPETGPSGTMSVHPATASHDSPFAFEDAEQVVAFLHEAHAVPTLDAWELVVRVRRDHPEFHRDLDALAKACRERLDQEWR